jgi:transcriptional regulator with XRE-family HTH domain
MKTDPILLSLGKNVSSIRKEKGLTQKQLSEYSNLIRLEGRVNLCTKLKKGTEFDERENIRIYERNCGESP